MSDSQEKSDDLIAELAKLMANNAGPDGPAKPSVIKLPPLNDATIKATPVRIPGMEPRPAAPSPAPAASVSSTPAVRIPGMEKPAGLDAKLTAPQARPITQFDFGKPPTPAPIPAPEPLSNWQSAAPPKLPPAPPARPPAVAQLAEMKFDPVKPIAAEPPRPLGPPMGRPTAGPGPIPMPPAASVSAAPPPPMQPPAAAPSRPSSADSFGFDFGFGPGSDGQRQPPAAANDPIADLIAAELDSVVPARSDKPVEIDLGPGIDVQVAPPTAAQATQFNKPMPSTVAAEVLPNPLAPKAPAAGPRPAQPTPVQIKPVSVTPRGPETDRFNVAPVFGAMSSKPPVSPPPAPVMPVAAPPPAAMRGGDLDPMDEIENLIGEAVRVELSATEKAERGDKIPPVSFNPQPLQPAPVVPPLNSGFAPRRANVREAREANVRDREPRVDSAEAAILAAAAASGAEVGHVDDPAAEERPYKRMKVKPPRTSGASGGARQYVGIAVAGTLLLAAGFGLYWVIGMGRDNPQTAPVLVADEGATKVPPAVATADTSGQSGSVVFNEINGSTPPASSETLVSRDETAGATAADVAAVVADAGASAGTESGLANRKVRTVTVRPDGTIVSGDEALAGAEELPIDRPNLPAIDGPALQPSELLTAVSESASAGSVDPIAALVAPSGSATTAPLETAPLEVASATPEATTAAAAVPATFDGSLVAPIPMPRPFSREALAGGSAQAVVPAATVPSAIAPASTPLVAIAQPTGGSGGNGPYVQLSSQPSQSDAQRQLRATQQRMSGMLNGAQLEIRAVDLGAKGMWYRVVLPVNSFRDATQTCAAIKANGLDCVAING